MSHSYEVTEIELLDGSMAGIVNDDSQLLSDAPSNSILLAKLLKNVRMSYVEAGKDASEAEFLLDESRKRDEKDKAQTTVAETVKKIATNLQQKFGVEVEVIDNPDSVPNASARQAIAAGQNVRGWYDINTSKAYLYAPNIESEQDAITTYIHEAVAHGGMRQLLGEDKYNELCEKLYDQLTDEQKERISQYSDQSAEIQGDEYFAAIAETMIDERGNIKEPSLFRKFVATIRDFFRDILGISLSDNDIRYMLWKSANNLKRNSNKATQLNDRITERRLRDEAVRMSREETDYQREIREITERAKADGTFMKTPNGKPSKLDERQWAHVRSTRFKKWFGNWEKAIISDILFNHSPIARLKGTEFSKKDGMTLTEQVAEFFEQLGGVAHSPLLGDVKLDKKGADDSFAHGMGRLKAVAYGAVKDVIENGVIIDTDRNHKGRGYDSHVIAGKLR